MINIKILFLLFRVGVHLLQELLNLLQLLHNRLASSGFSISFGVDGLNIKVGGRRSKFHRGGLGPEKFKI